MMPVGMRNDITINVTVSIGMEQMTNEIENRFAKSLAAADQSLYKAKESGRNQVWHNGPLVVQSG